MIVVSMSTLTRGLAFAVIAWRGLFLELPTDIRSAQEALAYQGADLRDVRHPHTRAGWQRDDALRNFFGVWQQQGALGK